jgi:hypothetical protein
MSGVSAKGTVSVLLGAQWGDEGKGKIIDYLIENYNVSIFYMFRKINISF